MKLDLLPEPELQFGAGTHVDIRFGLRNYGPITFDDPVAPKQIRIGFIGTPETVAGVQEWLTHAQNGVPAKRSKKPNLFPAFPGFGKESCFACDWVTSPKLQGFINPREVQDIIAREPRALGVEKLVQLFIQQGEHLSSKGSVDVLVCAPPQELFAYTDAGTSFTSSDETEDEKGSTAMAVDFHDMLKARGMVFSTPMQLIRPATYDERIESSQSADARSLQDPATRAWNFHVALYYKAGGTPWRIIRSSAELVTCFIGVSFYRSRDRQHTHTSIAQVFNERGEGMILRGGDAERSEDDKQPHLKADDMAMLVQNVVNAFHSEHRHWPARVVIHKTSSFNQAEKNGCESALRDLKISSRDLLTVSNSYLRLFRNGQYPPLRGTFLELDSRHSILYTRGSIDFYQMYPGMYVPRTLQISGAETEQPARMLAQEILALTKMNWNNTQFDAAFPITIKAARQVGSILRYLDREAPIQAGYAFYM